MPWWMMKQDGWYKLSVHDLPPDFDEFMKDQEDHAVEYPLMDGQEMRGHTDGMEICKQRADVLFLANTREDGEEGVVDARHICFVDGSQCELFWTRDNEEDPDKEEEPACEGIYKPPPEKPEPEMKAPCASQPHAGDSLPQAKQRTKRKLEPGDVFVDIDSDTESKPATSVVVIDMSGD